VAPAIERDEGVGRGIEHEAGALLGLTQLARVVVKEAEQPRDQEPGDERRAHGEQPAHDDHVGVLDGQHHGVRDRQEGHLGERLDEWEEVERVERRPHVEQRVERGRPGVVIGEADDHRARGEHGVHVPVTQAVRAEPDARADDVRDPGEDDQRDVAHLVGVRERKRHQAKRRPGREEVGD
jgi:hypothetical protein